MRRIAAGVGVALLCAVVTACGSTSGTAPTATPSYPNPVTTIGPSMLMDDLAEAVIGLSEADANDAAVAAGAITRVGSRDGEDYAVTMDYNDRRLTFTIVDGFVTEATVG